MKNHDMKDDNDRLLEGTLPQDPFADAEPLDQDAQDESGDVNPTWNDPLPIGPTADVPTFPVETLPPWLGDWVTALATALQCPVDLPAMLGLAVLALSCAKKYKVHLKGGWFEPLNLYVAVALKPGESKSPAFSAAIRPVNRFVAAERERMEPENQVAAARIEVAVKRIDHLKGRAAKAKGGEDYTKALKQVEEATLDLGTTEVPAPLRLILDDVTSESLQMVMHQQGGRIAIMSDEGGPFELMGGRYSQGIPNIDIYLKAHNGGQITTDRVGRQGGTVNEPALTIGLAIQPEVITSLKSKKGFRGRGLLARFLWSIPQSLVGRRAPDAPQVPEEVREAYEEGVINLLKLPTEKDKTGEIRSRNIEFGADAYAQIVAIKEKNEPNLGLSGELEGIPDWGNKFPGALARIAGLLYMADRAFAPPWDPQVEVGEAEMLRAVRIGEFLQAHALIAFDMMESDPVARLARYILAWIRRKGVAVFTVRDAYQHLRARFKAPTEMEEPLELLIEHEVIRRRPEPPRTGPGRPPSPTFEVNPKIHTQNSQNSVSGGLNSNSVNSVNDSEPRKTDSPVVSSLDEDAAGKGDDHE